MDMRMLEVVDEEGNILRQATRGDIHQKGLLHAEVHVWFYTPAGQLIFQHRSKDKDSWPDLLDATVGGHVEIGDTYEASAMKEAREETGVEIDLKRLIPLCTLITTSHDPVSNTTNHARRAVYAYCYTGALEDLVVEKGKALGFELWPIDKLSHLSPEERLRFIPFHIDAEGMKIIGQIRDLL